MKKKRSAAFVLVMAILLITLGALAAVPLSSKEFVENVLAPKAIQNQSERWTQEEVEEILRIAEENGPVLSEEDLAWLREGDGEDKETLMRMFAKVDLGFYPSTWSIEDQAWYDQLLLDCGVSDRRTRFLPEEGEKTEAEAKAIAIQYILDHYDGAADVTDEATYRHHAQYMLWSDEGEKIWDIEYVALDLTHDTYVVLVTPQGDVREDESQVYPGLRLEGEDVSTPDEVYDRYEDVFGSIYNWEPETWVSFREALQKSAAVHGCESDSSAAILVQEYGVPDAAALSREEAIQKAAGMIVENGRVKEEELRMASAYAVYLLEDGEPVWRATIPSSGDTWYWVEMDAQSGNLRKAGTWQPGEPWYRNVVLDSIANAPIRRPALPEGFLPQNANTRYERAVENAKQGKTPFLWGSDAAPDFFWQRLEEVGFGPDTAEALVEGWIREYGRDARFWPLEEQALIALWGKEWEVGNLEVLGLPDAEDVQRAEAEGIAWKAYKEAYRKYYGEETPEEFVLAVTFLYNRGGMGNHTWNMEVIDPTRPTGQGSGMVVIDAKTGMVLIVDVELGGNG